MHTALIVGVAFITGAVVGALAAFFVSKNNRARIQKLFDEAEQFYQDASNLRAEVQELYDAIAKKLGKKK